MIKIAGFIIGLLWLTGTHAQQSDIKVGRLNMGYYFYSINETVNRADVEITLNFWSKELIAHEGTKRDFVVTSSKAVLYEDIEEMKRDFENGELDLINAPPLLIARYFNRALLGTGFMGLQQDKKLEHYYLIANNRSNIASIKNLPGKRLMMLDRDETAEIFLDSLVLKSLGKSYKDINLNVQYQNKSNRIILDVFFNAADTAIVYGTAYETAVELNPAIKDKIKILAEYAIKSKNFSYFRRDYNLSEQAKEIAINFEQTPRGKQILEVFRFAELAECSVDELDAFDRFYQEYLELRRKAGIK